MRPLSVPLPAKVGRGSPPPSLSERPSVAPTEYRLLALAQRIEHFRWQAQAGIAVIAPPERVEICVRVRRQFGERIEIGELVGGELARRRLRAPDVPRQDFGAVERGEIADQIAGDEPQAAQLREFDAEGVRVELAAPAFAPGVGGDQESIARDVERVVTDGEIAGEDFVELDVEQGPAPLVGAPIFADPVILVFSRIEIAAEADPRPGG